jgi:hypothetical protein
LSLGVKYDITTRARRLTSTLSKKTSESLAGSTFRESASHISEKVFTPLFTASHTYRSGDLQTVCRQANKDGCVMSIKEFQMSVIVMIDAANCIDIQNMRFIQ